MIAYVFCGVNPWAIFMIFKPDNSE